MNTNRLVGRATLFLVIVGIALNLVLSRIALYFELPIFLDSIGTIVASIFGGYLPGVAVGFFSNYANSIFDPITAFYALISVIFALLATFLSARGLLRRFWQYILCSLAFALIGGGLGSILTWFLYGEGIGEGISAPLTALINNTTFIGTFFSQLSADMAIDVADKLISFIVVYIIVRLTPRKACERLPLGNVYLPENRDLPSRELYRKTKGERRARIRASLVNKVSFMVIALAGVLIVMAVIITTDIYDDDRRNGYISKGEDALSLIPQIVNGDEIKWFTENGPTGDYDEKLKRLQALRDNLDGIEFLYILRITDDECEVIFDTDAPTLPRNSFGDKWLLEDAFKEYKDELLRGDDIPPVESNDKYGWLYSVYKPIRDSSGDLAAYMAVDILMEDLVRDKLVFSSRVASMLCAASILIIALILWFIEARFVKPITSLTDVTSRFAYDSEADRNVNSGRLLALNISTGDEIEDLYHVLIKTTSDVSMFITKLDEKTREVENKVTYISKLQDNIILSFANIVENRDETTGMHIKRTADYVTMIAKQLKRDGVFVDVLTGDYIENLTKSAPLHDIGKVKIPESILNKPARLTPDEFDIIKTHTVLGRQVLDEFLGDIESGSYLSLAKDMAMSHHEHWDGNGYPKGLKGDEIPLCARIMAIADVYDALVSRRSYKEPMSFNDAKRIIDSESGKQFDPAVVTAFDEIADEIRNVEGGV